MRRFRAPERDCLEVEEEETTAVILPQLDLLRVALVFGGERRRPRLPHCHGAEAARVLAGGERGRGGAARRGGGRYAPEGGPGSEGAAVAATATRR